MTLEPYWSDDTCQLYVGDMREVLPALNVKADLVLADPPYGKETSLEWDRWPDGWLQVAAGMSSSLWCFGSMRMFGDRWGEFGVSDWNLSQDIIGKDPEGQPVFGDVHTVWQKHNGPGFQTDRFRRTHEHALHWYRGAWSAQHRDTPKEFTGAPARVGRRKALDPAQYGARGESADVRDGTALMRSVIAIPSMNGRAIHPCHKPQGVLQPMIRYACPESGLVVDPFAGSGSTLMAARMTGRRAIGIERDEGCAERSAEWLSEPMGLFSEVSDGS